MRFGVPFNAGGWTSRYLLGFAETDEVRKTSAVVPSVRRQRRFDGQCPFSPNARNTGGRVLVLPVIPLESDLVKCKLKNLERMVCFAD